MTTKFDNIDGYISQFPNETKKVLEQIRVRLKRHLPKAEEVISYGIPCFKQNENYIIYFAGYAKHVSLYPAPVSEPSFKDDFANYKTSKGTVQFPLNKPMPLTLIDRIAKYMLAKNKERAEEKKSKRVSTNRSKSK